MSKLRENAKTVIGVGVKNSTSDLLTASCDEFIYYDDLVRQTERSRRRKRKPKATTSKAAPKQEDTQLEGIELVAETAEALLAERGDNESLWGSMVKQTLKRRRPGFHESFYGFKSFSELLEEARERGLLELERDRRSGGYLILSVENED